MRTNFLRPRAWLSPAVLSAVASVLVALAGPVVLIGWWLDLPSLTGIVPGLPTMAPSAALGLTLAGVAFGVLRSGRAAPGVRRIAAVGAVGVSLLGGLTLLAYVTGWDVGTDRWFAITAGDGGRAQGLGRPSFHSALLLALVGPALLLLDARPRRGPQPAQFLALVALHVVLLALLGQAFRNRPLYVLASLNDPGMALPAALLGGLLCVGILCARPDTGFTAILRGAGGGGAVARRLLLIPVVVPLAVGLAAAGAQRVGLIGREFSSWLFAAAYFTAFTLITWWVASVIQRADDRRAHAEETVRLFADVVGNVQVGLIIWKLDGQLPGHCLRLVSANPAASDLLGIPLQEQTGKAITDIFPAVDGAVLRGFFRVARTGRAMDLGETRYGDARVAERVWATKAFPLPGDCVGVAFEDVTDRRRAEEQIRQLNEGLERRVGERTAELAEANVQLRDEVAERRRAEEALRQEEERFRGAFEHTNVAMVLTDLDNRFVRANAAFARLFGYSVEEVLGLSMADITHPEDLAGSYEHRKRLLAGESPCFQMEKRYLHKDGHVLWGLTNVALVRDAAGRPRLYVGQVQDITERRRAAEALRASEERVRLLVEGVKDYAILMLDPAGRVASWNAGAERIKGYAADEIIGQHFSRFYPPEAVEKGWPEHELRVARAEGRFEDEGWRVRKDGTRFWANVVITAVRDESGDLRGFSKVTRDITERKRAEEVIRQRTDDLAAANRDLTEKNQENEMFVYSVSHDLRSPLVNLQGFSKELGLVGQDLRDLFADEGLPPAVRQRGLALADEGIAESVHFIQAAVMRLSSIIDALLRLSRAGRVEYQWQPVDVKGVVARVVESLHGTVRDRGATVTVRDVPPTWGDPTAVEQVFANLLGNALKYLDPQRPGQIEVGSATSADVSELGTGNASQTYYVKDNGLGIPEAHQAKVFQAFQRVHPEVASGEGIGLTIVHRIVQRHGGKVRVESAAGQGSTFVVTLPGAGVCPKSNGTPRTEGSARHGK